MISALVAIYSDERSSSNIENNADAIRSPKGIVHAQKYFLVKRGAATSDARNRKYNNSEIRAKKALI